MYSARQSVSPIPVLADVDVESCDGRESARSDREAQPAKVARAPVKPSEEEVAAFAHTFALQVMVHTLCSRQVQG